MAKSPLSIVKEKFESKEKLVAAVEKFTSDDLWVARTNKSKGLAHVSNAKLVRLHTIFSAVKEKFGTRAALIDAILEVEKRSKDDGYKTRISAYPVPRLWDLYKSAAKRNAPKTPKAKKTAAAPQAKAVAKPVAKKSANAVKSAKKTAAAKKK